MAVLRRIQHCRTGFFGSQTLTCPDCGFSQTVHHSCGDRNCPTCQSIKKELWIDKRKAQLLDCPHFHVIFTVPHQLNPLFLHAPKQLYGLLFDAAWKALQQCSEVVYKKGARTGMLASLHTWGSNLSLHPHLHCIVPAGALDAAGQWQNSPHAGGFLVGGRKIAACFKKIFLAGLRGLWEDDALDMGVDPETGELLDDRVPHDVARLASPDGMTGFILGLQAIKWNVRIERPMAGIEKVVEYLARYVYRSAITNGRIQVVGERTVTVEVKKYANSLPGLPAEKGTLELDGVEFLRRLALHFLPKSFQRIRYYGFYAPAAHAALAAAAAALGTVKPPFVPRTAAQIVAGFLGRDPAECPACKARVRWLVVESGPPPRPKHCTRVGGCNAARPPPCPVTGMVVALF